MPASIARNEVTAAKRECDLIVYNDAGNLAPRETDFIDLGILYVGATGRPHFSLGLGTCTNKRIPLVVADDTFTAAASNICTAVAHGLQLGDGPLRLTSSGTLPAGLALSTDYWVIPIDVDTFYLAASLADAYDGTQVDITGTGSGTHTLSDVATTQRGLDGFFTYQFTQAETDYAGSELSVLIEGSGFSRANNGGTYTSVQFGSTFEGFEATAEGAHTFADLMRLFAGVLAGTVVDFTTGTLVFKSLDGSKTRLTVTTGPTGRLTCTVGDLT